jgi:flagellar basal body-associated protein FliL
LNPIEETEPTKKKLYSNTSNAFEYKVGPIDFNLAEKNRFVTGRIGFSIPCESKRHFNELKALNPYIKDAVIRILSTKNIEECRDINKIKTELLAKINSFTRQGQANSLAILDFVIE